LHREAGTDRAAAGRPAVLAEANARAEHWAAQADRWARQVERMREAMEEAAEDLAGYERFHSDNELAERLRAAAKGEDDAE